MLRHEASVSCCRCFVPQHITEPKKIEANGRAFGTEMHRNLLSKKQQWYHLKIISLLEKQIQKLLGYSAPAICYSPDEESGAATSVGFKTEKFIQVISNTFVDH